MLHREDCAWKHENECCCGLVELEAEVERLREIAERHYLFADLFEEYRGYTRHDHDCTYDQLDKGDVCTCGLRAIQHMHYKLMGDLKEEK